MFPTIVRSTFLFQLFLSRFLNPTKEESSTFEFLCNYQARYKYLISDIEIGFKLSLTITSSGCNLELQHSCYII